MKNVGWELDIYDLLKPIITIYNQANHLSPSQLLCHLSLTGSVMGSLDLQGPQWMWKPGSPEKPLKDPTFPTLGHLIETTESFSSSQPSISKQKIVQLGSSNGNNLH